MLYRYLVISLLLFSALTLANPDPDQAGGPYEILKYETPDGAILVEANVDWSAYTKVQLTRGTVGFRENWVRDQRNLNSTVIRESDLERVKTEMADLLEKVLIRNLSERDSYALTAESGADVLRFTPNIVNLDIYTPDFLRDYVGHELTDAQGSMVIVLDIHDSVSGKLLASAVQKLQDAQSGYFESTSRGTHKTAFRRMMERWSSWFFAMMEKVRSGDLD